MSGSFPRLFISLKKWLFPNVEHSNEYQHKSIPSYRIDKPIEARVIHQYPKKGNFRFPVIKDEIPITTDHREKNTSSTKSNIVINEKNFN
ncbi:MAG: hypothetical protein LRY73_09050 [Bacillus sp. (in: Bacteria)]|nr:hypothetical protein [Bacillus sp. (in: firmicutes)]